MLPLSLGVLKQLKNTREKIQVIVEVKGAIGASHKFLIKV